MKFIINGGEKFNRVTIVREIEPEVQYAKGRAVKIRKVECLCVCGITFNARLIMIRNGSTKSCGCLKKEQDIANLNTSTHCLSKHPLYRVWASMKSRCYNTSDIAYKNYGGRGISVCERWLNSFENFFEDMKNGYADGLEIERIKVNGNYHPDNCKWDTPKNQANNRRNTIWVLYGNEILSLSIACEKFKFNKDKIKYQMRYHSLSFKEAVTKLYKND